MSYFLFLSALYSIRKRLSNTLLTHSFPMHPFSTSWKHQGVEKGCIGNEWVNRVRMKLRSQDHEFGWKNHFFWVHRNLKMLLLLSGISIAKNGDLSYRSKITKLNKQNRVIFENDFRGDWKGLLEMGEKPIIGWLVL